MGPALMVLVIGCMLATLGYQWSMMLSVRYQHTMGAAFTVLVIECMLATIWQEIGNNKQRRQWSLRPGCKDLFL